MRWSHISLWAGGFSRGRKIARLERCALTSMIKTYLDFCQYARESIYTQLNSLLILAFKNQCTGVAAIRHFQCGLIRHPLQLANQYNFSCCASLSDQYNFFVLYVVCRNELNSFVLYVVVGTSGIFSCCTSLSECMLYVIVGMTGIVSCLYCVSQF